MTTGIHAAIQKAGSQVALAELLGVTQQAISKWLHRGYVPVWRALEIENQLGVPREDLVSPKMRRALALNASQVS